MEYPNLYLDWINYLRRHKLYGAWIKDVVTYVGYITDMSQYYTFQDGLIFPFNNPFSITYNPNLRSYYLGNKKTVNEVIDKFSMGCRGAQVFIGGMSITLNSISNRYVVSTVHWHDIYRQFIDSTRPILSKSLTRKLSRKVNKDNWRGGYKEKVEQPWYSKSYEKYNKKTWRK